MRKIMQHYKLRPLVRPSTRSLADRVEIRAMREAEFLCSHLGERASCIGKVLRVSEFHALYCDMFFDTHACELEQVMSTCLTSLEYRVTSQLATVHGDLVNGLSYLRTDATARALHTFFF
jgi:hypothetical protein